MPERDAGLQKAIAAAGGIRALARALDRNHALVSRWTKVPYEYLLEVERVTGVRREVLRPELFRC
ncbi:MAG TPA: YdaS family helix-turn-helix protein [Xanthobacteraceae bacterium]|jgi:DNA-binding transcriptional regulator YdaS (Cro superfamily)